MNIGKMTIGPIDYEYENLGTLRLKFGKVISEVNVTNTVGIDTPLKEQYLMWANFEAIESGATYCATFDDDAIRQFCPILSADPDLLDDFLVIRPNIQILLNSVTVDFSLHLGSKKYTFTMEIPKFVPDGSLSDVTNLYQKNNILVRRIKTLEEAVAQQNKNIIMLTDLATQLTLNCCHSYPDKYMLDCIEIVGEENMLHYYEMMINHIKTMTSSGYRLLKLIEQNKMPKFKKTVIEKHKEIYLALIDSNIRDIEYIDKILRFCRTGIEINSDCIFEGSVYLVNDYVGDYHEVKYSMIEYFDYQVNNCIPLYQEKLRNVLSGGHLDSKGKKYLDYTYSVEFQRKCDSIRILLINLSKK